MKPSYSLLHQDLFLPLVNLLFERAESIPAGSKGEDTAELFCDSRKFNLDLSKNKNVQETNVLIENKLISEE